MLNLDGTPYSLKASAERSVIADIKELEERVEDLRHRGTLNKKTLKSYCDDKRFQQVAESNAIEGNTLSPGETEHVVSADETVLAELKGTTLTDHDLSCIRDAIAQDQGGAGSARRHHDLGCIRDAIALDKAWRRAVEMAQDEEGTTTKETLRELHDLLMGERPGAGIYRNEGVRITGAQHVPPKSLNKILDAMDEWEGWSLDNHELPEVFRCAILHAWLTHIHPYGDGNGRLARAVSTLELVRAGYPPVIIKKSERERYLDALAESDEGGDIRSFLEFILEKTGHALTGLELSAQEKQGYNRERKKIQDRQKAHLTVWNTGVELLAETIKHHLSEAFEGVGSVQVKLFDSSIDFDDYISLSNRKAVSRSWCFIVTVKISGEENLERLAWVGYRSPSMFSAMRKQGGPALVWSVKNPDPHGYPKWIRADEYPKKAPYCTEMTTPPGEGDSWHVRLLDGKFKTVTTTELAKKIAGGLIKLAADGD